MPLLSECDNSEQSAGIRGGKHAGACPMRSGEVRAPIQRMGGRAWASTPVDIASMSKLK